MPAQMSPKPTAAPFKATTDADKLRKYILSTMWKCGDCGNVYTLHVTSCNNSILDGLIAEGTITQQYLREIYG